MTVSREPEFGTVRMREGYDLDDVDNFVDLVIDSLERRPGRSVTPDQIERYEFRVVRMKTGYVMEDVDRWLDGAAAELRTAGAAPAARPQQVPQPSPLPQPVPQPSYAQSAPAASPNGYDGGSETAWWPAPPATPPAPVTPPVATPVAPAYSPPAYEPAPYEAAPAYEPAQRYDPAPATQSANGYGTPEPDGFSMPQRPASRAAATIHHLELWVRDFDAAVGSFGWLFQRVGWRIGRVWEHGCAWTTAGGPYVVIESGPDLRWMPYDRRSPGINHLALEVADRATVDRLVAEGPEHGWSLMFPDRHPFAGGPEHYAAYLENVEGFEVEIVAAE